MLRSSVLVTVCLPITLLSHGCGGLSQEALLDAAAKRVIEQYEVASCESVATMQTQAGETEGGAENKLQAKAIELLKNNPDLREEFINRVAGPIANRMFECNLVP